METTSATIDYTIQSSGQAYKSSKLQERYNIYFLVPTGNGEFVYVSIPWVFYAVSQEYFIYTTGASILVGGNQTEPGGKPQSSAGC